MVWKLHTVVALGNAVLYPPALGQVGDLGPVLVRVGGTAEGAAGVVGRVLSRRRRCGCCRIGGVWVVRHGEHV